jgi:hypothetical protein
MTTHIDYATHSGHGVDFTGFRVAGPLVRKPIALSVVFSSSGQLVGIEDLTSCSATRRIERTSLAPQILGASSPNFLWDRSRYALGVRRRRGPTARYGLDDSAFNAFRRYHRLVLGDTSDLALQAFLKFLDQWSPAMHGAIPTFGDRLEPNVVFRFQYEDDFLHNQPAARRIWARMAGGQAVFDLNIADRQVREESPRAEKRHEPAQMPVLQAKWEA